MTHPSSGYGHNPADKEAGWGDFTVTPSYTGTPAQVRFTVTDTAVLLTTTKMIRAVIMDAIDQWLVTNAAQLVTNSVTVGDSSPADFGGSDADNPGDGGYLLEWTYASKYAETPSITTTSLTTAAITVSIPYADVI
jgi:hypothetical protein